MIKSIVKERDKCGILFLIAQGTIAYQEKILEFQVDTRPIRCSTTKLVIPSIADFKVGAWAKVGIKKLDNFLSLRAEMTRSAVSAKVPDSRRGYRLQRITVAAHTRGCWTLKLRF